MTRRNILDSTVPNELRAPSFLFIANEFPIQEQSVKFDPRTSLSHAFYTFRQSRLSACSLWLNNLITSVSLRAGETTQVRITPLNVDRVEDGSSGFYSIEQLKEGKNTSTSVYWQAKQYWSNEPSRLVYDRGFPFLVYTSATAYFPTETSVYIPLGAKYQVRTYGYDDKKEFKEQSSYELDLQ